MKYLCAICALALLLTACGEDTLSLKVHPAQRAPDAQAQPPEGWQRIEFAGSPRGQAGIYFVRTEPLLTEFNIIEFRDAGERTISVRLNAYSIQKLQKFASDSTHLKKPLAININDRWADLTPLLEAPKDRMFLHGFTDEEKAQLRHTIDTR